ncbi:TolC family protein [Myroides injenensis]|uniref:TolC family protein n=1 Tax=Myroides injenensis TaxID=1183151 RepID=UPI0002891B8E|nr:TolC family protein [Myroides injenensis]
MKIIKIKLFCLVLFPSIVGKIIAQNSPVQSLTLQEVVQATLENHPQLKLNEQEVRLRESEWGRSKTQRLPTASVQMTVGYQGNTTLLDKKWQKETTLKNLHLNHSIQVTANQTLYKGKQINLDIKEQALSHFLAQLDLEQQQLDLELEVSKYYLNLYREELLESIYIKNKELAEERLALIQKYLEKGMVTKDEVLLAELQISDIELKQQQNDADQQAIQKELRLAMGDETITLTTRAFAIEFEQTFLKQEAYYMEEAREKSVVLQKGEEYFKLQGLGLQKEKANRWPELYAFIQTSTDRPVRTTTPQLDIYTNTWQMGLGIRYDLTKLYTAKKREKPLEIQVEIAKQQQSYAKQQLEKDIAQGYLQVKLKLSQRKQLQQALEQAKENYRIIQEKYLAQLVLYLDVYNASNILLETELKVANNDAELLYSTLYLSYLVGDLNTLK